jgi:hypothetical protein
MAKGEIEGRECLICKGEKFHVNMGFLMACSFCDGAGVFPSPKRKPRPDPGVLAMWTVYDHPSDFPECFVARKWEIPAREAPRATAEVLTAPTLTQLRELIVMDTCCLARMDRDPAADPKIVEVWL